MQRSIYCLKKKTGEYTGENIEGITKIRFNYLKNSSNFDDPSQIYRQTISFRTYRCKYLLLRLLRNKGFAIFWQCETQFGSSRCFAVVVTITSVKFFARLILSECYSLDLLKSWRWRTTMDCQMPSSSDTLWMLLTGLAEFVKVTKLTGVSNALFTRYSPSAT